MATPAIKLTYFPINGRGGAIRQALQYGKIPFEDVTVPFPSWPAMKPTTPFGSLPLLEVDGVTLTQSNAILSFVGKMAGLYPEDPLQAALMESAMCAVEDCVR